MIAEYDGDVTDLFNTKADGIIPILATRNMVLFPGVMNPILIGRARSLSLIKKVEKKPNNIFAIFCQKDPNVNSPTKDDIFEEGVYARLIKVISCRHWATAD